MIAGCCIPGNLLTVSALLYITEPCPGMFIVLIAPALYPPMAAEALSAFGLAKLGIKPWALPAPDPLKPLVPPARPNMFAAIALEVIASLSACKLVAFIAASMSLAAAAADNSPACILFNISGCLVSSEVI